ncbi:MAG TPA: SRPBCC domain-containing protein [Candidatus Sulfotelmatobacter sp.]|jgi:uncharacterized protein YndB with AHSA1/START domain
MTAENKVTSAKCQITADSDAVIAEIEIAATPDRVFQAIVDREQALQWAGGEAFEVTHWELEPRVGGKWRLVSRERQGKGAGQTFDHHGEVVQINPPHLLEYTWLANWHPDPNHRTTVRWELTTTKTGTILKVTHSGLAPLNVAKDYAQGWPGLVEQIKNFVEK